MSSYLKDYRRREEEGEEEADKEGLKQDAQTLFARWREAKWFTEWILQVSLVAVTKSQRWGHTRTERKRERERHTHTQSQRQRLYFCVITSSSCPRSKIERKVGHFRPSYLCQAHVGCPMMGSFSSPFLIQWKASLSLCAFSFFRLKILPASASLVSSSLAFLLIIPPLFPVAFSLSLSLFVVFFISLTHSTAR